MKKAVVSGKWLVVSERFSYLSLITKHLTLFLSLTTASLAQVSVHLAWTVPTPPNLQVEDAFGCGQALYNVYRGTSPELPYLKLNEEALTEPSYVDVNVPINAVYDYVVTVYFTPPFSWGDTVSGFKVDLRGGLSPPAHLTVVVK